MCGVVNFNLRAVGEIDFVNYARNCSYEVQVVFSFESFLDYLKVKKTEESAPEAEAESSRCFRFITQCRIVELKFFKSVSQVFVIGSVCGVYTAEHHRIYLAVTGQRFGGGALHGCHRVADACVAHGFYRGGYIAYFSGGQLAAGLGILSSHISCFNNGKFSAGCHHSHCVSGLELALDYSHIYNNAFVAVVNRVKNQSSAGLAVIGNGWRNKLYYLLKHLSAVFTGFRGYAGCFAAIQPYHIFNLRCNSVRVSRWKIDFIDYRYYLKVVVQREISVGKRLRFNALGGVYYEYRPFAGSEGA